MHDASASGEPLHIAIAKSGRGAQRVGMVNAALADKEFKKNAASKGMDAVGSSPEALQRYVNEESQKWRSVIRQAGIKLD